MLKVESRVLLSGGERFEPEAFWHFLAACPTGWTQRCLQVRRDQVPRDEGVLPFRSSEGEACKSEWNAVLLDKSVHGRTDIQADWWVSPMVTKHALIDAFKSLCCLSTDPKLLELYSGVYFTMTPSSS